MAGERHRCAACGGDLVYQPGQPCLVCPHCGASQAIDAGAGEVRELDFRAAVTAAAQEQPTLERQEVICGGCGAHVALEGSVQSDRCPYCATQLGSESHAARVLQPRALLPFGIVRQVAQQRFHGWLRSRWFAPSSLQHLAGWEDALQGVYVPYWTYDATVTHYTGARGENYWSTLHRPRQRQAGAPDPAECADVNRRRGWSRTLNDILVLAGRGVPGALADRLDRGTWAPWCADRRTSRLSRRELPGGPGGQLWRRRHRMRPRITGQSA